MRLSLRSLLNFISILVTAFLVVIFLVGDWVQVYGTDVWMRVLWVFLLISLQTFLRATWRPSLWLERWLGWGRRILVVLAGVFLTLAGGFGIVATSFVPGIPLTARIGLLTVGLLLGAEGVWMIAWAKSHPGPIMDSGPAPGETKKPLSERPELIASFIRPMSSPSWVILFGFVIVLAGIIWGIYSRESGWAIAGATVFLAATTYVLAIHTERLAKATERSEALEAVRQRRIQLDVAIDAAMVIRSANANLIVQQMAAGYVPEVADAIHSLATNAGLIEDKDTRRLVEKWSNLFHTYPQREIVALAPRVSELEKDYQTMKDRVQAEILRWEKELKA